MEKYGLLEEHEMDSIIADPQLLVQQLLVVL
mgnify:CR=1 FL=1